MEIILVYHDDQEQENKHQIFSYRISEQAKYMYMNITCYWFKGWLGGGGCNYSRDDYSKMHWVIIYFYYFIYDYSMKSSCAWGIYR